jgi:hypothetical protein
MIRGAQDKQIKNRPAEKTRPATPSGEEKGGASKKGSKDVQDRKR